MGIIKQLAQGMALVPYASDGLFVNVSERNVQFNSVAVNVVYAYPRGEAEGARYDVCVQVQVLQFAFPPQKTERDIAGLDVPCEPGV